jgi:hypothetical protein
VQEQTVRWSRNWIEHKHAGGVDADHARAVETNRDAVADVKLHCSTIVSLRDRGLYVEVDRLS